MCENSCCFLSLFCGFCHSQFLIYSLPLQCYQPSLNGNGRMGHKCNVELFTLSIDHLAILFFFTSDTVIDTLRHSFSRCNLNVNVAPSNPLCTPGSLQLALRLFSLSPLKMYKLFYRLFIIFIVITMSVNDDTWLYT